MEGPQASEHIHAGKLENISKLKKPNMGRISRSHVSTLPHHLLPLLTHFLHQFQQSYLTLLGPCAYRCHETSMMSLPAESFGDRFCMNRISRAEGSGWVHPKGANCMAASGLSCRKALVGTRRPISVLFGKNVNVSTCKAPISGFQGSFLSYDRLASSKSLH